MAHYSPLSQSKILITEENKEDNIIQPFVTLFCICYTINDPFPTLTSKIKIGYFKMDIFIIVPSGAKVFLG